MKKILFLLLILQGIGFSDEYCNAYQAYETDDFVKAETILNNLVFKGNSSAQNLLGVVSIDEGKESVARTWFQNASGKGDLKATYNLGIYYASIHQNANALRWMLKAEPLLKAKVALGVLYANTDIKKSKEYFFSAATEGNSFAASHLCSILAVHQGPKDNKYVNTCQGRDVINDLYITGKFYTSPKVYGSTNIAIHYLEVAADNGNLKSMNLLGEMLYKRRSSTDEERALAYFEKAAAKGSVDAKVNAAWIYYTGVQWTRKPELGLQMLNRAISRGNARAKFYMGMLYRRGQTVGVGSVTRNPVKGLQYIEEAAAQNDIKAIEYMINNGNRGEHVLKYKKQLKKHLRKQKKLRNLHYLYDEC